MRVKSNEPEQAIAGDPGVIASMYDRYARLVRSICFDIARSACYDWRC
jgi:hypothetical protein